MPPTSVAPGPAPKAPATNVQRWTNDALKSWTPAAFPDGQGGTWTWAEPGCAPRVVDGQVELSVLKFTRRHDQVQIFDNPKHLLAGAEPIPVPDDGVFVETTIAATVHNSPSAEWGYGFAAFNLMDFEHGLVLDGLASSTRTGILYERLLIPSLVRPDEAFTAIADGPRSAKPGAVHRYGFLYEPRAKRIRGWIDDAPVLDWRNVHPRINAFTPGIGLITLRPIEEGRSVSLRGQGATGRWGEIRVTSPPPPSVPR